MVLKSSAPRFFSGSKRGWRTGWEYTYGFVGPGRVRGLVFWGVWRFPFGADEGLALGQTETRGLGSVLNFLQDFELSLLEVHESVHL
jgi:hypothetical protein